MSSTSAEVAAVLCRAGELTVDALLFDMDGTLVDSHAAIAATWTRFAERHELPVADVLAATPGRLATDIVAYFVTDQARAAQALAELRRDELAEQDAPGAAVRPIAGAGELLAALPQERWAVVTSATRRMAEIRLRAAGLPTPNVLVAADDVERGKPDPSGFLLAAERLGVAVDRCCVFEDSSAGLDAATRAGCEAIAVGDGGGAIPVVARVVDFRMMSLTVHRSGVTVGWMSGPAR